MFKNTLALLLLILLSTASLAQKSAAVQKIIDSATSIENIALLNAFIEKEMETNTEVSDNSLQIIQKVIQAQLLLSSIDSINTKSSLLFNEAVKLAESKNNDRLLVWAATMTGFYFYSYSDYQGALPFYLVSSRKLEGHQADFAYDASETLKKNAYFFATTGDHLRAIRYYKMALTQTNPKSFDYGSILNGIGSSYAKLQDLERAESFFMQTRDVSQKNGDEVRYAKALGDLACLYTDQGMYDKALPLFLEDIRISELNSSDRNTMWAKIQLSKLFLKKQDWNTADEYVLDAERYARSKSYLKGYEEEIAKIRLQVAIARGDTYNELMARRLLDSLESIVANSDGLKAVEKVNYETQKERILWQLEAEQSKVEKATLLSWLYVLGGLLLLTILFVIFIFYRKRIQEQLDDYQSKVLSFQTEKDLSEKKLSDARNSLDSYKVYLNEKNVQIKELLKTLKDIRQSPESYSKFEQGQLEKLLESHLMTEENWQQFKKAFILEQGDYYEYIIQNFPNLTESNLRIIFLQKIGLNNPEMAQILGISLDAIKKAKQRLRKKHENLFEEFAA